VVDKRKESGAFEALQSIEGEPVVEGRTSEPDPGGELAGSSAAAWSARDLLLFVVSAALALVTANLLALTAYAWLQPVMGWKAPSEGLRENPFFLLTLQTLFYILVLGYVYLLIVVNYRQRFWAALRWRNPSANTCARFFLGGIMLAVAVQFTPAVLPDREDFPLQQLFSSPEAAYALAAFAILIAPLLEEIIFRGVLFLFFERLIGLRFAIAGTAILFAAVHVHEYWGAWNHVLLIFMVGLAFSLARGLTGSLAPSVILHTAYNACLMVALFVETTQFQSLGALALR
jgi:membrane protease YdiL (CAAX protease family)